MSIKNIGFSMSGIQAPDLRTTTKAFSNVSDMIGDYQTRERQKAQDLIAADMRLQQQANADRTFSMQEKAASTLATENERKNAMVASKLQMQAEQNAATNKYQADTLTERQNVRRQNQGNIQYNRNMESGEILGNMMNLQEMEESVETQDILDKKLAKEKYAELSSLVGTSDNNKDMAEYHKYLAKNDPNYYKGDAEKLLQAGMRNTTRAVPYVAQGIKSLMQDSSDAAQYQRSLNEPVKSKGLQTFEQFKAAKMGTSKEIKKYDDEAKKSIAKWIATDKNSGAFTKKEVNTVKRVPKAALLKQVNSQINDYKKAHPKVSKATLLGMYKAASAKITKIEDTRNTTDMKQIERFNEQADAKTKATYKAELAILKDKLDRAPTRAEKSKLKTEGLKRQRLEQEIEDNKGWFD